MCEENEDEINDRQQNMLINSKIIENTIICISARNTDFTVGEWVPPKSPRLSYVGSNIALFL